ncbi:nuclear transport factor 2 family protein [Planotetraspora sp. A-T 1434]|uniref:YybH family protein n=1 Tax=Planotetraspora sp. A-T 1434 TaxID=2979219 RepID=UPI0021BE8B0B|nr:nuclear transport factor 2 family protein [Planotetraspora sp. A-T 1434]MCT9933567.1 nuclear transport factor 2 family protein [Planotetraspora sp. A-T 1434]
MTYPMPAPPGVRAEVDAFLHEVAEAYNTGDYEAYMAAYLPSEETTMVIYEPGDGPVQDRETVVLRGTSRIARFYAEAPMFKPGFDRPTLTYEQLHTDVVGTGTLHTVALAGISGGDTRVPAQAVSSLILVRDGGLLRIAHDHSH